jgi:hypothetical protein
MISSVASPAPISSSIDVILRRHHQPGPPFHSKAPLPALEMIANVRLGHVEVACWSGFKPLRFPGSNLPWCHFLSEPDWRAVVEDWKGRV